MKTIFYINGEKITRKKLNEFIGKSAVREIVFLTKEHHFIKGVKSRKYNMGSYGEVMIVLE